MRLHRLQFAGIGPFRHSQEIDFDQLSASGLFLIDGPTGAGKSTVIDAIVFALYGDVSGRDADDSRLRSDFSAPDEPSFVECEFTVGDRRVWLRRTPKYLRLKANGKGTTPSPASQQLRETDSTGAVRAELTQATEIGAHISKLLGMSAQQFRQLVVLPQGEFAALLRMKPMERFTALGPLLGDEFFRKLQLDLEASGVSARTARLDAAEAVRSAADALGGVLGELDLALVADSLAVVADPDGIERDCAAQLILDWLEQQSTELAREVSRIEAAAEASRAQLAQAKAYLSARAEVESAQSKRAVAVSQLDVLDQGLSSEQIGDRISELDQSSGSLQQWVRWEQGHAIREAERLEARATIDSRQAEVDRLTSALAQQPSEREALERNLQAVVLLAATAEQLERNFASLSRKSEQVHHLAALEAELALAAGKSAQAELLASQAQFALDDCSIRLETSLQLFAQERAASLAHALADGQPCPVCGALEHPLPAISAPGLVTEADIEQLRSELKLVTQTVKNAQIELKKADADKSKLESDANRIRGALDETSVDELPSILESARQALDSAETAAGQLPELREAIAELVGNEAALSQELQLAINELTTQQASFELLESQWRDQAALRAAAIGESDSAIALTEEMTARAALLRAFLLAEQELALATSTLPRPPEVEDVDVWAREVQADAAKAEVLLKEYKMVADQMRVVAKLARKPVLDFQEALTTQTRVDAETVTAIALGDAVTAARGGINTKRMTLQSYAVQRRFASVLSAASIHLARMSAGKYALELDDEARGNAQAGLGIKVRDEWTGQARDPRSLSGGETFYAALALALGLADVVRDEAGGSQLETLFVDEGFGSLDQESLQLVLDQLDLLRSGGRIVGVVSHVTEMKEWVQQRVEVSVGPDRTSRLGTLP
ncbi:MAG: SMC family ATPase [Actinomycetota bacterium]|nr:SMC family ATPase [Actinomycetota bacterium]